MQQQLYYEKKKQGIEAWDWLLIIGFTLAPMNTLRIWKVGPGEALCLLWCVKYYEQVLNISVKNYFVRFWLAFIPAIIFGAAYCRVFYPSESSFSGIATYVYFFVISVGVYVGMMRKPLNEIQRIIYIIGIVSAIFYFGLYLYSIAIRPTIFGIPLWYRGVRFAGGANNPHQVAVLISAVGFVNVFHVFDRQISWGRKMVPTAAIVFSVIVAVETQSSTLIFSIAFTFLFFIYFLIVRTLKGKRQKWIATAGILIIVTVIVGLFREQLYEAGYEWVASDANGLGRITIFKSITDSLNKSWLIGLGPGVHGLDGTIEYHNAYLEILAMGGLLGITIFLLFSVRLFRKLLQYPGLCFCMIPLYAYGMAGFSMRRLVFWVMAAILTACAEKYQLQTNGLETPSKRINA